MPHNRRSASAECGIGKLPGTKPYTDTRSRSGDTDRADNALLRPATGILLRIQPPKHRPKSDSVPKTGPKYIF